MCVGGGGGVGGFWGDHLILRRTEEGSVVTESPKKGGSLKIFGRIQGGTTQVCLVNATDMGGAGAS